MRTLPEQYWKPQLHAFKQDVRLSWVLPMGKVRTLLLSSQTGGSNRCDTFASSSPLEGDIDYSHRPKPWANEKVRICREKKKNR